MSSTAVFGSRQQQRAAGVHHHQRQVSDSSSGPVLGKWLQSSNTAATLPTTFQQQQSSRRAFHHRTSSSSTIGSVELFSEFRQQQHQGGFSTPPPAYSRSSSKKRNNTNNAGSEDEEEKTMGMGELSPGILDLHAFDTELLPPHHDNKSFPDSEPCFSTNKQSNWTCSTVPDNLLRISMADREKTSPVAKIKVVVRKRPLNKKEISKKEDDIITIEPKTNSLTVHETKLKVDLTEYVEKHEFVFDAVLGEEVTNDEVYRETVEPIVPIIFQRTKATCFAYGQTGSGKTYTMQPLPLKASHDILDLMQRSYRNQGFQLFVSFFEIYGGKLFDLLNDRRKLCMREDGKQQVCIVGLQEFRVSNVDTIREYIEKGNATRSTGTTGANEESSRSHAILQLAIKKSVDGNESKPARIVGKLSFIDLAGSERGADTTDNDRQTRMEGAEINKSLLALKECIRALDNDQGHIPFRGSKLTEVLRDSFMGDSRTVMISCISPNSGSCEHTLNTLRYADRVKSLSKGASSKKDLVPTALNLRDSSASPLCTVFPAALTLDSNSFDPPPNDSHRFGWSRHIDAENGRLFGKDNGPPSGRDNGRLSSFYSDYEREQSGRGYSVSVDDFDFSDESHEQENILWKEERSERYMTCADKKANANGLTKWRDEGLGVDGVNTDDFLRALLKEEEELVTAHRNQVEEMVDIVKEELKLLMEANQPGNQLDVYISKLNDILSQKAAGIVQLQRHLTQFQKRLTDTNILICPQAP
ncbi:kinesin-like protein KIN-13B isoform X1 [Amborella trichopoda]|uniref:Kinesin-like protein n=1 Tax=Amborella trichopoda TaxID=13333 RepID=W1NYM3_AMBTC|nr:kinesin-like protein KIN-13B isoform X1 [Amborella trichopoda]ERN00489.1 hypothetical protein AMTR_s00218p00018510 [Amborella trichopoda]|eukprot:XP_006837920.1 kinesin-like protein KIN-13B isoform X1 [Amborella trichopoda]